MEVKMPEANPAMQYCSRTALAGEGRLCREKMPWFWQAAPWPCFLLCRPWPRRLTCRSTCIRSITTSTRGGSSSTAVQYWSHYYLIRAGFLVTRMVGYFLIARWLYKGGPEVEELLFGATPQETSIHN